MKKRMIAGNWKMYKNEKQALAFLDELEGSSLPVESVERVICPPYLVIPVLTADPRIELMGIQIGAQNGHWEQEGAYTGEVSIEMIHAAGCQYVILGHSERRTLMGETDDTVNRKVMEAVRVGVTPIICLGETATQRNEGITGEVIARQLQAALHGLDFSDVGRLVIAYEPVWAIGSGTPASPQDAEHVHREIRTLLADMNGADWADDVAILYGGSVKPDNIADFLCIEGIDGALVGGASLDPASFLKLVEAAEGRP